jgi:hypothetical protein
LRLPLLRVVFESIDKDKSGGVDYAELAQFGQYIGNRDWTEADLKKMFKDADVNNDGVLSLTEFQDFCFKETGHHSSERFQAMIQVGKRKPEHSNRGRVGDWTFDTQMQPTTRHQMQEWLNIDLTGRCAQSHRQGPALSSGPIFTIAFSNLEARAVLRLCRCFLSSVNARWCPLRANLRVS